MVVDVITDKMTIMRNTRKRNVRLVGENRVMVIKVALGHWCLCYRRY